MSQHNAIYYPYGAYELKAKYQRNLALATLSVLTLVLMTLGVSWVIANWTDTPVVIVAPPEDTEIVTKIGPPITIIQDKPEVDVGGVKKASTGVGIPTPVPDEEIIDDNVVIATRQELADLVGPGLSDQPEGNGQIVIDLSDVDYFPSRTEFVPVEIYPEMIDHVEPEYPRLARSAGLEGRVTVQVLVDKDGKVRDCAIARSSDNDLLDEAACRAGKKCRFKPGIQNGRPVSCWVAFNYEFRLGDQ